MVFQTSLAGRHLLAPKALLEEELRRQGRVWPKDPGGLEQCLRRKSGAREYGVHVVLDGFYIVPP